MYGMVPVEMNGRYEIKKVVVKASTTITKGDPVHLENGVADLAAAGEPIYGVAMGTVTQSSSSTTEIEVLVGVDIVYKMDNDNDTNTFATTGYGSGYYFDMIGNTGAVLVDTSSASATVSGQLVCVDQAPDSSDTSIGLFKINKAESQS